MVNDEQEVKHHWLSTWFKRRRQIAKRPDTYFIRLSGAFIMLMILIEIWFVVPGISTGLGITIDYILITLIYSAGFLVIKRAVVPSLKFLYITRFTLLIATSMTLFIQSYFITKHIKWNEQAAIIFAIVVTVSSILFALIMSYIWFKKRKLLWINFVLILLVIFVTSAYIREEQLNQAAPIVEPEVLQEILIEQQEEYRHTPVMLQQNPAEPGPYSFTHTSYSSSPANPIPHKMFDAEEQLERLMFSSVDGSTLLTDWSWTKKLYWGFSEQEIPITGDLWIPEGDGPFPIVYIMHGNHISETDSSIGYTYLGELLASYGYIVSSIDANFLNYSVWSGIVDDDQLLRAWLFLAHITSFYEANLLPIDWQNVALVGHSRGGQAAAMAVDIDNWIEEESIIKILDLVNINAVISIAPTDYGVDSKFAYLRDVNYLTIHGTLDSDLTEFFGERQFERTTVDDDFFKASVMIYGANHGQFNETWGKYDDQFPSALLLNTEHMVDETDQQLAAKIFINGFLQSVFEQRHEYRQLFQDTRVAQSYLPVTGYVTRYEDSHMEHIYTFDFEHDTDNLVSSSQLNIETVELKGRNGSSKYNDVLKVNWDIGYSHLLFPLANFKHKINNKPIEAFVFQVAKTQSSTNTDNITDMNIDIDFKTDRSLSRINLLHTYSLLDPYLPKYLKLDFLEGDIKKGKYESKEEPYLQTYIIPLSLINKHVNHDTTWDVNELNSIQFWFKDKSGTMLIDDIGVIYEGGSYVSYE